MVGAIRPCSVLCDGDFILMEATGESAGFCTLLRMPSDAAGVRWLAHLREPLHGGYVNCLPKARTIRLIELGIGFMRGSAAAIRVASGHAQKSSHRRGKWLCCLRLLESLRAFGLTTDNQPIFGDPFVYFIDRDRCYQRQQFSMIKPTRNQ